MVGTETISIGLLVIIVILLLIVVGFMFKRKNCCSCEYNGGVSRKIKAGSPNDLELNDVEIKQLNERFEKEKKDIMKKLDEFYRSYK